MNVMKRIKGTPFAASSRRAFQLPVYIAVFIGGVALGIGLEPASRLARVAHLERSLNRPKPGLGAALLKRVEEDEKLVASAVERGDYDLQVVIIDTPGAGVEEVAERVRQAVFGDRLYSHSMRVKRLSGDFMCVEICGVPGDVKLAKALLLKDLPCTSSVRLLGGAHSPGR